MLRAGNGIVGMCWVDLSHTYREEGEVDEARRAADAANEVAAAASDPWIRSQTEANRSLLVADVGF